MANVAQEFNAGNIAGKSVASGKGARAAFKLIFDSPTFLVTGKGFKIRVEQSQNPTDNYFFVDDSSAAITVSVPDNAIVVDLKSSTANQSVAGGVPATWGDMPTGQYSYAIEAYETGTPEDVLYRIQGEWDLQPAEGITAKPLFISDTIEFNEITIDLIFGSDQIPHNIGDHQDVDETGGKEDRKLLTLISGVYKPEFQNLNHHSDVTISIPQDGHTLEYLSGEWVNIPSINQSITFGEITSNWSVVDTDTIPWDSSVFIGTNPPTLGADGVYTVTSTGIYRISAALAIDTGGGAAIHKFHIVINGTPTGVSAQATQTGGGSSSVLIQPKAQVLESLSIGATIAIEAESSGGATIIAESSFIQIEQLEYTGTPGTSPTT